MSELLPVAEAQARLLAAVPAVSTETLSLIDAIGRWAAAPLIARRTQPESDLSAMDGYAVTFGDLPGPIQVIGESAAGRPFSGTLNAGEATRIFTGAAVPDGADTVMVQEEAKRNGDTLWLDGEGPARVGANIRRRGLDFEGGETLVQVGEQLTPARLAVAATGGLGSVSVRRKVRVAIAATGDELTEPGSALSPGRLPESNRLLLRALLSDLPVDILDLGILPDQLEPLTRAFRDVRADVLVTTGGASVGDHDLVRPALIAAGASIDFWRIALRPGKPLMAGWRDNMAVLGLPGNPVSAFVTAVLFVKPLIAKLAGATDPFPRTTTAILGEPLPPNGARTDYLRAELRDGLAYVAAIQDSSMLRTLARAGCLVVREPHAAAASAGDSAEILVIA
ncbi:molybdopterin molybdotransferase MoeA [Sphingomonas sp.]|jgi:molybdopterin molybdotransferase|uniref:molybdopterin molybdotransferase MoeA n=1 Tax=Sphingomonas sp. TaxID=28214 RepID=UPI00262C77EE|nr:molybdopterin molybdotransferase MoeA [Sphingomonas sp.]MDF2494752.1 molybdopterin molybdenumtransferase MoeA [Sphingomonas sp.]